VIARLDRGLMESGTPKSVARAEALALEMLEVNDAPMEPYHWMVYFHQKSELTSPELTVRVALAAENATDREEYGMWPQMLDMAYAKLVNSVKEEQGLDAALSKVELLKGQTDNPSALAALNAALFSVAIEEDTDAAIAAAAAIADLDGLTGTDPSNRVAYDLAERGLAPDVAIRLSKQALALASSRYDSTLVLDTVGWAYYAAGEHAEAAGYLETAVRLMDETLTYENETVQHLLMAYESGGMSDEAIELLATIVARSVDADDPARALLATRLVERDGNASAMEALVAGLRYEGVEVAPAFTLADTDGNMVTLDGLKGDVLVVCFWSYG
jgi:tetratricopeptide (TPR) repeat protein